MYTSGVTIHLLGYVALEMLRIQGSGKHNLAPNHHRCLSKIWCTVGSIGRMQSQSLSLITIASALCSHVVQNLDCVEFRHDSAIFERARMALAAPSLAILYIKDITVKNSESSINIFV